jgi:four helix bundle protein
LAVGQLAEMKNNGFRDLEVWQLAKLLVVDIYKITESFPAKEQFGLTNQIRRSAVSVSSNLAEGSARGSDADFARFLSIALGSLAELENQLMIAKEIGFLKNEDFTFLEGKFISIGKMLRALKNSIKNKL